jgi:hypothetical protein
LITADHVDQIERLGLAYFHGEAEAFAAWLREYHKVNHPREFATAAKGKRIIKVLKDMHTHKEASPCV